VVTFLTGKKMEPGIVERMLVKYAAFLNICAQFAVLFEIQSLFVASLLAISCRINRGDCFC
jgi:hypothetical protein